MSLIEKVDSNKDFKVAGLGYEKNSAGKSVANKLEKAAKVVATTGTVIAGIGTVGKAITETVEKFTGETTATKWIKYGFDTAGSAGKVADSASNIIKKPKDVKTWTDELVKVNKNVEDRIKKGIETKTGKKFPEEKPDEDDPTKDDGTPDEDDGTPSDDKKPSEDKPSEDKSPAEKNSDDKKPSDDEEFYDEAPEENPIEDLDDDSEQKSPSTAKSDLNTLISSAAKRKNGN